MRHLLTYECNLRCTHCYLSAGNGNDSFKINFDAQKHSFESLHAFYSFFKPDIVSATGGEPLIEQSTVFKLAVITNRYGGALELVTNGFYLNQTIIDSLREMNPRTFYQISLDGHEDEHNKIRQNKYAFAAAIKAIRLASSSGARTKVRLTATDDNFDQIPTVIRELEHLKTSNIELVIRPVVSSGRAKTNNLVFTHNFEELDEFAKNSVLKIETTDNVGHAVVE